MLVVEQDLRRDQHDDRRGDGGQAGDGATGDTAIRLGTSSSGPKERSPMASIRSATETRP